MTTVGFHPMIFSILIFLIFSVFKRLARGVVSTLGLMLQVPELVVEAAGIGLAHATRLLLPSSTKSVGKC